MAELAEHVPDRPRWDCRRCAEPWPCDPARESLMRDDNSATRGIYLSIQLHVALQDMPASPAGELYDRFIAWMWQTT